MPPAQSIRLAGALTAAGATVELELVPGASHFWNGASDVPAIVRRSIELCARRLDRRQLDLDRRQLDADYGGPAAAHDG